MTELKTERLAMVISPSEVKAIDDWAWENRIRSKSEAARRLIQIGLTPNDHSPDLLAAGKHLAVKLAEIYKAHGLKVSDCQAMREWMRAAAKADGKS